LVLSLRFILQAGKDVLAQAFGNPNVISFHNCLKNNVNFIEGKQFFAIGFDNNSKSSFSFASYTAFGIATFSYSKPSLSRRPSFAKAIKGPEFVTTIMPTLLQSSFQTSEVLFREPWPASSYPLDRKQCAGENRQVSINI
jgi:hypothetical protein